jgi:steroid delta-isomerase-like uncharacterized protein
MSSETNKAIVQRYYDQIWNNGRLDLVEEFIAEDFSEDNGPNIPGLNGRDALKVVIGGIRASMPDLQITLHDVVAEGNKVVTRYSFAATHQGELMGIPATGNQLAVSGAAIFRLANARIEELWNFLDNLGMMQQLGVVPTPETA